MKKGLQSMQLAEVSDGKSPRRIASLRAKHADLDRQVTAAQSHLVVDDLAVRRLKQKKLRAKDELARLGASTITA